MKHTGYPRMARLVIVTAALGCFENASTAQDADLERCASIVSDTERLACFDALLERPRKRTEAPAPIAPVDSTAAPGLEVDAREQPAAAPAASRSEMAVQEAPPSRRQDESPVKKPDRPREYTAAVVEIRERPHGQKVVTLDNGEVWSEQFASRAFLVDVGDTVTMKRRTLSRAYRLVAPSGRGYPMTRWDQ